MHRFFAERTGTDEARLTEEESRHALKVLRLRSGDPVELILPDGLYEGALTQQGDRAGARVLRALPSPEAVTRVTLFQGLPKGDKMDLVVQKGTEAGVAAFTAVEMSRSVARLSGGDRDKKAARWQRIAMEAAKQCGRSAVPPVTIIGFKDLKSALSACGLVLVPWEEERAVTLREALRARPDARDIGLVIGPEGGIDPAEIDSLKALGAVPVTLGRRIFRTETAGLAAAIMTLYERGEYD